MLLVTKISISLSTQNLELRLTMANQSIADLETQLALKIDEYNNKIEVYYIKCKQISSVNTYLLISVVLMRLFSAAFILLAGRQ